MIIQQLEFPERFWKQLGFSGEVLEATWVFRRGSGGNLGKSGEVCEFPERF